MAFTKKPDPPKPPSPTPRPVTPKPQPQETDLFGPILAWWRRYPRWQRRAFLGIAVVVVLMLIGATQSSPPSQRQAKPACEQRTYTIDPGDSLIDKGLNALDRIDHQRVEVQACSDQGALLAGAIWVEQSARAQGWKLISPHVVVISEAQLQAEANRARSHEQWQRDFDRRNEDFKRDWDAKYGSRR
jgi:hypothetical protein